MDLPSFSVTWDYRCPFARNAHEHLLTALEAGAGWEVGFIPFSLTQAHVEEGELSVWDDPSKRADLLALQAAVVVRDRFADRFLRLHRLLFEARHDRSMDVRDPAVLKEALVAAEVPRAASILDGIMDGEAIGEVRAEHEKAVSDHAVFGVPTFISEGHAAFVRVMNRPGGDSGLARSTIERIVTFVAREGEINEMKRTTLDR